MPLDLATLIVDDYDRALGFLTEALGFTVAEDSPSLTTDGRPKRWVVVRHGDAGAGLVVARADGPDQAAAVGRQFAGRVGFFLQVDDVDACLDRVQQTGGALVRPPRDEPYGRVCVIEDLWGNRWDLLGPVAA